MKLATALAVLTMMAGSRAASAQEAAAPPANAWGTRWSTITTLSAWSFMGPLADAGDGYRRCASATGTCRASVNVPGGSVAWSLDIEACDSSSTTEAVARMWACAPAPATCAIAGEVRSGMAGNSGCARFFGALPYPYVAINNWNYTYFVDVFATDGATNVPMDFRSVRVMSVRQLSPAPSTATFSDVPPSHPYFRHIEALSDALISGGCGNGQFCPDRPLTRGEVAVLLAEALGLNFPD